MQPGVEAPLTTQRGGSGERAAGGEMEGGASEPKSLLLQPHLLCMAPLDAVVRPFSQSRIKPPLGALSPSDSAFALPPFEHRQDRTTTSFLEALPSEPISFPHKSRVHMVEEKVQSLFLHHQTQFLTYIEKRLTLVSVFVFV